MRRHILVAVDDSPQAWDALEYALETFPDDDITTLYVMDPMESVVFAGEVFGTVDATERVEEEAADIAKTVDEVASVVEKDVATDSVHGRPTTAIVDYAIEHEVDHVVVGSHGRTGLSRILLGSVAETIVRRSPVPVTVVR